MILAREEYKRSEVQAEWGRAAHRSATVERLAGVLEVHGEDQPAVKILHDKLVAFVDAHSRTFDDVCAALP